MAAPDPKKPPAGTVSRPSAAPAPAAASGRTTSGELAMPALPRYTGPDPKVMCGMVSVPGPTDQVVDVVAHVTAEAVGVPVGQGAFPALRGPIRTRMDSSLPPGEKPLPAGGAQAFELELALTRFQDRAYAVARVGPGVPLGDSDESTATGLQKVAWKLPRPC
jgi:hypothetical protein